MTNTATLPQPEAAVKNPMASEIEAHLARLALVVSPADMVAMHAALRETHGRVTDAQRIIAIRIATVCENVAEGIHNLRVWAEDGDPSNCYDARYAGETRD